MENICQSSIFYLKFNPMSTLPSNNFSLREEFSLALSKYLEYSIIKRRRLYMKHSWSRLVFACTVFAFVLSSTLAPVSAATAATKTDTPTTQTQTMEKK